MLVNSQALDFWLEGLARDSELGRRAGDSSATFRQRGLNHPFFPTDNSADEWNRCVIRIDLENFPLP